MEPSQELAQLQLRYPLPRGWSISECHIDTVVACGVRLRRAGIVASHGQDNAIGAACELSSSPVPRGYFELLERCATNIAFADPAACYRVFDGQGEQVASMLSAQLYPRSPDARLRPSSSNGTALRDDRATASRLALAELVERDRVLRSWAGAQAPTPLTTWTVDRLQDQLGVSAELLDGYDIGLHALGAPSERALFEVVVMHAVPRRPGMPLLLGFGCHQSLAVAETNACREWTQQLGFLWGEEIAEAVQASPSPDYHQEFYQLASNHHHVAAWLQGERTASKDFAQKRSSPLAATRFVDITPQEFSDKLSVIRAVNPDLCALVFGATDDGVPHPIA